MNDLSPELQAVVDRTQAALPSQETDEFTRLRETLLGVQACTSLSDEEATERVNRLPSGTMNGWQLTTDPDLAPVPCQDRPETHRHLIFEC